MRARKLGPVASGKSSLPAGRPLCTLLSQVLIAFTLEFDNAFVRRMNQAGYHGATLSMVLWSNLIRFVTDGAISVRDLAHRALAPEAQIRFQLGCSERWGYVVFQPDSADDRPVPTHVQHRSRRMLRDGWGSGRGIRSAWTVLLTEKGRMASEVWPLLFGEVERRWRERFGGDIASLREVLEQILGQVVLELPEGLPGTWETTLAYPARTAKHSGPLPLPALLSQVLLAFTLEFDRLSQAPLRICASTLRVLGDEPIPVADIPRLTGSSPETSGIGRRDVGTAARQRMRELVAQSEMFQRDPAGTLPHYPLWDMNRGFGP
jgi:hypothetical protein